MTPTSWARAVEAMRHAHWQTARGMREPSTPLAGEQYKAMLRAALPHLLRAVVEQLGPGELESLRVTMQTYLGGANVYPAGYNAVRAHLFSALTAAAGRVGG